MIEKFLHRITPFIGLVLFLAAIGIVHHELKSHTIAELMNSLHRMPLSVILLGVLLTAVNYLFLTGYDFLALHYLGKTVPRRNVILASLISFSISNNIGQALISGSSMRYRFYSQLGLSGMDIIKFSLFVSLTYALGATTLFGITTVTSIQLLQPPAPMVKAVRLLSWIVPAALVAYWSMVVLRKTPFIVRDMEISLPGPGLSLGQTFIAMVDLILSALILYLFVRVHVDLSFHAFLAAYIAAQILGLFSQIPGGLGVFEGTFLYFLGENVPASPVFAALLIFRLVYYFIPLLLSGAGLLAYELNQHRTRVHDNARIALGYLSQIVPHIFSILLVLSGGLLLVSGSTPTDPAALKMLYKTLPLSVVEASHLMGSIVGVLILLMARAVRLRIDAAYFGVLILLATGVIASLFKGFDWQEALVLGTLLILFLPSHRFFYRKSSLLAMPFSSGHGLV